MNFRRFGYALASIVLVAIGTATVYAQQPSLSALREAWNQPQKPFQIYGNTYYVGTRGLGSILISSPKGHVLIDGALPESAPLIVANIRALGFRIEDVKLILNTHVHFDHAGGISELQKLSGAKVAASKASEKVLLSGEVDKNDPQYGGLPRIEPVAHVSVFKDGDKLTVGDTVVTAHLTPGHTPGGTSWTWKSCEGKTCLNIVYGDSLNPISGQGYLYTDPKRDPNGVKQLEASYATIESLACDILVVPHPELVDLLGKLAKREQGASPNPFIDTHACKAYVQSSREALAKRIATEQNH
jgi:metallo-beta-lactamase class B